MHESVALVHQAIQNVLLDAKPNRVMLACSGGLDSQVLLHACASLPEKIAYQACLVDYDSPHAKASQESVKALCDQHNIPLAIKKVSREAPVGASSEAYWRDARYGWFKSLLTENDVLFTAHHQDDQAETVLLQWCRGAGLGGLSAMPHKRRLGEGFCWRPLLSLSRDTLSAYAEHMAVPYVDDPSNDDQHYARNYLRHSIMPLLKKRWPSLSASVSRSAEHCQEAQALLTELAVIDTGMSGTISFGQPLSCDVLAGLSKARQGLAIRHWMSCQGVRMPAAVQLDALLAQLSAGPDKHPCVMVGDCDIRRRQNAWYLTRRT